MGTVKKRYTNKLTTVTIINLNYHNSIKQYTNKLYIDI